MFHERHDHLRRKLKKYAFVVRLLLDILSSRSVSVVRACLYLFVCILYIVCMFLVCVLSLFTFLYVLSLSLFLLLRLCLLLFALASFMCGFCMSHRFVACRSFLNCFVSYCGVIVMLCCFLCCSYWCIIVRITTLHKTSAGIVTMST